MHEISVALEIAEQVAERSKTEDVARVTAVHLRIGAMTAIDVRALEFAWELVTEGTPAARSKLVVDAVPLALRCARCDAIRTVPEGNIPVCPVCDTPSCEIVAGRELQITAMEVVYAFEGAGSAAKHSAKECDAGG